MAPVIPLPIMASVWIVWIAFYTSAAKTGAKLTESTLQKPNLILRIDQPKKHTLEKYVHQLDVNVILVNKTGILTLRLDCWAPYPIDLRFHGHLTNQETTVKTFRKVFGTVDSPQSWFIINATMDTYEQITGNYTCASVEHPEIISSYYIFVSPTPPGVLLTRGQKIRIKPKLNETNVIFPCAVSHPNVHVQLFKDEMAIPSAQALYDPKVGFTIDLYSQANPTFGSYSCRTELSPDDRVNITLIPPDNFQVQPQISSIRLPPEGQLNISCDGTNEFIIAAEPSWLPVILNEVKRVNLSKSTYFEYTGSFISEPLNKSLSGYLHCKWKHSNASFKTWEFAVTYKEGKIQGQLDTSRLTTACPNTADIILYECSNLVECRINSCLRKDSQCHSNAQKICSNDKSCMQSGLIQCPSDITPVMEIFFTGFPKTSGSNKTIRYVEWNSTTDEELLLLKDVSDPVSTSKMNAYKFACQGSNFVFSSGFKWKAYLHGGALLFTTFNQRSDSMNIAVNNVWKEKKSMLESTLTIFVNEAIETNISVIECHAPMWNSWRWVSRNISVNLTRPVRNEDLFVTKNYAAFKTQITFLYILSAFLIAI